MNYRLYIGMNRKNGGKVREATFINVLNQCCKINNIIGYSVTDCNGYYIYNNGNTCIEKSKVVLLVGIEKDTVLKAVEYLKKELNQESIMLESVTSDFDFL